MMNNHVAKVVPVKLFFFYLFIFIAMESPMLLLIEKRVIIYWCDAAISANMAKMKWTLLYISHIPVYEEHIIHRHSTPHLFFYTQLLYK